MIFSFVQFSFRTFIYFFGEATEASSLRICTKNISFTFFFLKTVKKFHDAEKSVPSCYCLAPGQLEYHLEKNDFLDYTSSLKKIGWDIKTEGKLRAFLR